MFQLALKSELGSKMELNSTKGRANVENLLDSCP